MFITLPLVLVYVAARSGGDTVKSKTPVPATPAKSAKSAPAVARTTVSSRTTVPGVMLAGKAIENAIVSTARAVAPRTSYLSKAIAARMTPPPIPSGKGFNPANAVNFTADSIVVEKSRKTLTLFAFGAPVRIYFIALGRNPVGDKVKVGDKRTPEGLFHIEGHNPGSHYHLSLKISYPDAAHAAKAKAMGVSTGGDIMIHGLPPGFENVGVEHTQNNWTDGCIALTNAEIEEIWSAVPDGAPIRIKP